MIFKIIILIYFYDKMHRNAFGPVFLNMSEKFEF